MEKWQEDEWRRSEAVRNSIEVGDRVIMDASDGSVEEINFLTALVAEEWVRKAMIPHRSAMMRKDLEESYNERSSGKQVSH